ncbi:MAG: NAD-dependent epimerase/dehydratase family protein, partial [Planctomycetes bacterium]|nr:NAD-dependent epimerase/dehydratase family protein [Planctomycetota bacterium]
MRVLLTGATGFVGGETARQLVRNGHSARVLVRDPGRLAPELAVDPLLDFVRGSLERPPDGLSDGVDAVLHLAGLVDARRPRDYQRVNAEGSRRLAEEVARRAPGARWIQVS